MKNPILLLIGLCCLYACEKKKMIQLDPLAEEKSKIVIQESNKVHYRDLNHNGVLDPYENPNVAIEDRIDDILSQMKLEDKAGIIFINGAPVSEDADPDKPGSGIMATMIVSPVSIDSLKMNHFNIWNIPEDPTIFAKWHNKLQLIAEQSRLGIPVTIASDPRHHLGKNVIGMASTGFSQFCEMTGFAAIGDENLVKQFADIVRKEYVAIGIREALHPQIDLATEPRWARISGNFSEDAHLTARLVKPYIEGLQGVDLKEGVACMTKHFPGGGPQKEGLDPHFSFQKGQVYPGKKFEYHLIPFEAAFKANTAAIMPYYGVPVGQTNEDVAMSYNKMIITTLLREKYAYDGVVCTDWGLITDISFGPGVVWKARAWGVEQLTELERVEKIIEAGVDQFGGESRPELVIKLVQENRISEDRLDISIRRLLRQKFELGLFDNPFVDESKIQASLSLPASVALGARTQKESMTLLKNKNTILPLQQQKHKVYLKNIDSTVVAKYAQVVTDPKEADFAIIRINTPWYPVATKNMFARSFHHGDLDFKGAEKEEILKLLKTIPTIVNIYLDRPAVIPEISDAAQALIADFGASDASVCEVLFGNAVPKGKLPFELPSSMEAVRNQLPDVPYDSKAPLFKYGFGMSYK